MFRSFADGASRLLAVLLLTMTCGMACAAVAPDDTGTRIFNDRFRTLKVSTAGSFMDVPVIRLGTDDRIVISFDELGDDVSYLQYRLIHCNADWRPSRLLESEYLAGFNVAAVTDYAFSENTFIHYVNYRIEIPNDDMQPLMPGNYLLQVFPEMEEDDVILQARFSITSNEVRVNGGVSTTTDRGRNMDWQQLSFNVDTGDFPARDPFSEFIVTIEQNGDPHSMRVLTHPMRLDGRTLVYEHLNELLFDAGNEFRRFETLQTTYPGMGADSVRYIGSLYHSFLRHDQPKHNKEYAYDQTQFGRFMVRELNATDSDLGADYVMVHFMLEAPEYTGADVYLDGEFTHHRLDDMYKMHYDIETRSYEAVVPLKQGSYNYRYVVVPRGTGRPDNSVDGNKYETRNEYTVKVFHRAPEARGDEFVGFARMYSFQ